MSVDCTKIVDDLIARNCQQLTPAGTEQRVVLLNYSDLNRALSYNSSGRVERMVMKAGKKAYSFISFDNSTVGEVTLNKGAYINTWDHALTLRIFTKTEESRTFVNKLTNSRVIAIVENKARNEGMGGVTYEVYGFEAGLILSEATSTTEFADGVVYTVKLASDDKSKETNFMSYIYGEGDGEEDQAALIVESLLTPSKS